MRPLNMQLQQQQQQQQQHHDGQTRMELTPGNAVTQPHIAWNTLPSGQWVAAETRHGVARGAPVSLANGKVPGRGRQRGSLSLPTAGALQSGWPALCQLAMSRMCGPCPLSSSLEADGANSSWAQ